MTEYQKKQIRLLRCKGWSYKRISSVVHQQSIIDKFDHDFCLHCGAKLEQNNRGRRKKFCGAKCKSEWEKTNRKIYILQCEYCGKEYKSLGNKNRKYCSHDCYIRDRFWRE